MSLILGLPEDVLREVFIHCLPANHNCTLSSLDAPLLLTHVCHHWRDIAFSTTRLWSSLHIPLQSSPDLDCAVGEWLARAGAALPLSVSFGSLETRSTSTLPQLEQWFKKMGHLKLNGRLSSFSFILCGKDGDVNAFMEKHRQADFCPTRAVDKLAVHIDIQNLFLIGSTAAFSSLELHRNNNLRNLAVSMAYNLLHLPKFLTQRIPFTNLINLDLQSRNFYSSAHPFLVRNAVLHKILSQCTNLTRLKTYAGGTISASAHPDTVLNAQLQHVSLFLNDLRNVWTEALLSLCDWPALTSLHLGSNGDWRTGPKEPVMDMLTAKFGSTLTSLRFTYPSLTQTRLLNLLSQLPCLVQLHVEDGMAQRLNVGVGGDESDNEGDINGGEDSVIEGLTPGVGSGLAQYCCPLLQNFRWDGRTRFSDHAIIQLLHKRDLSPVTLKQVVINFDREAQKDIGVACSGLVAEGLKLWLSYCVPRRNAVEPSKAYRGLFIDEDPLALGWK